MCCDPGAVRSAQRPVQQGAHVVKGEGEEGNGRENQHGSHLRGVGLARPKNSKILE